MVRETSLVDVPPSSSTCSTLEPRVGDSVGRVTLNGVVMTKELFTEHCATVPQVATLVSSLFVHRQSDVPVRCA